MSKNLYITKNMLYNEAVRGDSMNSVIYNPLEEFEKKFKDLHHEKTTQFFERLTEESKVDVEKTERR